MTIISLIVKVKQAKPKQEERVSERNRGLLQIEKRQRLPSLFETVKMKKKPKLQRSQEINT